MSKLLMKQSILRLTGLLLIVPLGVLLAGQSVKPFEPSQQYIADALQWQSTPQANERLCDGSYYFDPALAATDASPVTISQGDVTISSQGAATLLPDGRSVLRKHVMLVQRGRRITADKAYVYRDNHTGKLTKVTQLFGHVRDLTNNTLIVVPYAQVDLHHHHAFFKHAIMRQRSPSPKDGIVTSWSTATQVKRYQDGSADFKHHIKFSLCSPLHPSWILHAK